MGENKACAMPWCHEVGDFEVTTSRFSAMFQDDPRDHGRRFAREAGFAAR